MAEIDFNIPCWFECKDKREKPSCKEVCQIYLKMNFFIVNCGMPDANRYLKQLIPDEVDFNAFVELNGIKTNIVKFVENGENLLLMSTQFQNGKTTWSLKLMYKYFFEIWCGSAFVPRGYFVYVPDFLQKMRSYEYKNTNEFKDIDKILMNTDLVIWDDITANRLLPSDQVILNNYISKRIQNGKSNIFNGMFRENLAEYIGEDLANRFNRFHKILLKGVPGQ